MRLEVAKIAANGSIRQWVIDTAGRSDAGRWEELIARVPAVPPPYRAAPGSAVYDIRVDGDKFLAGEHDLSGPLSDLVRAVLVEGDAVLTAPPQPGPPGQGPQLTPHQAPAVSGERWMSSAASRSAPGICPARPRLTAGPHPRRVLPAGPSL